MISITSNVQDVIAQITARVKKMADSDELLRTVAVNLLPEVKKRIHVDGLDANGTGIGTYSNAYMKLRTGNYASGAKFTKGKNKGEVKNAGVYIKGKNKGQPRTNYNRTGDNKVVISLTRQMENDFSVQVTDTGYGLGYNNPENALKVEYVEATYNKTIFALTAGEQNFVYRLAEDYIKQV